MSWIGAITGDIVNSTEILNSGHREEMLEVLNKTVKDINNEAFINLSLYGTISIDIYRGDSFQLLVEKPHAALRVAILIRAALIAKSNSQQRWDARIGVGVGKDEFRGDNVRKSDGEAFRLSGIAFDSLGQARRLMVETPDTDFNEELVVSTAFADNIISSWTPAQAEAIYLHLLNGMTQKNIAQIVNKTPQTVNKLLAVSNFELVFDYITRFTIKTLNHLKTD